MTVATWKDKLQKGDKRVSGGWNQVWNGNKWVSTRKATPVSSGQTTPSTTTPTTTSPTTSTYDPNDPLYGSSFLTPKQRERAAQAFVEKTTTPESEIVAAGQRQLEGAKNIGAGYTASQESLQKALGSALGAIAGSTEGMAGSNVYSGLQAAQVLQNATPGMQGSALVAGTEGAINAQTRSNTQTAADARRKALADRLNELYKRDVDKSTAREQSRLTRETLGSKEAIASASNELAAQKFNIQTDIAYKRLAQSQQRLDNAGASTDKYLKEARATIKSLLGATVKTQDQTMGHLVSVYDPVTMDYRRKWYPGNWASVVSQAQAEFGPELKETDITPQGGPTVNPSGKSVTKPKYTKEQVRKTMIQWVMDNIRGYNKATATAWVDSQPEMAIA